MRFRTIALVVMTLAAAALGMLWYTSSRPAQAAPVRPAAAIPVATAPVIRADLPVYIDAMGTVQASKTATVTARIDGQLQKVTFAEGSDVAAGAPLAQIDPRPYQAQLAEADAKKAQDAAQLDNAQQDLQRYSQLSPDDYLSKQALDAARSKVVQLTAQVHADDAAIQAATTQLAYTSITAPFDGRTGLRLVDEGNIVHANDAGGIVVIAQLQPIAVIFTLPQSQLADALTALNAGTIRATALSSDRQPLDNGTVTLIDNRIDPATGTVRLKAIFPNRDRHLWPGAFVNVRMLVQTLHRALLVPADAIQQGPGGAFVYIVNRGSEVEMRPVEVARTVDGTAQISAGLNDGEQVVTEGQYRLQAGSRVRRAS